MNVLIELNQIDARATREAAMLTARGGRSENFYTDTDEPGENGDDEGSNSAPVNATAEVTRPVLVSPSSIRSITARRNGSGSRLTFSDGGGYAVAESYDEIKSKFTEAGVTIINRSAPLALTAGNA